MFLQTLNIEWGQIGDPKDNRRVNLVAITDGKRVLQFPSRWILWHIKWWLWII